MPSDPSSSPSALYRARNSKGAHLLVWKAAWLAAASLVAWNLLRHVMSYQTKPCRLAEPYDRLEDVLDSILPVCDWCILYAS